MNIKNVLWFEFTNYFKSKAFVTATVVISLILFLGGCFPVIKTAFDGKTGEKEADKIIFFDPMGKYSDEVIERYLGGYVVERSSSDPSSESGKVLEGEYKFGVFIEGAGFEIITKYSTASAAVFDAVSEMVTETERAELLIGLGAGEAEAESVLGLSIDGSTRYVGKDIRITSLIGYLVLFMMYMAVIFYGQFVLTSVITEKSSKTMEILVTNTKPHELLFGKVFGVGLAGLCQFVLFMLVFAGAFYVNMGAWVSMLSSQESSEAAAVFYQFDIFFYAAIYFLLGFFSFAFLYAALGSTVSKLEESNGVSLIPSLFFVLVFMVAVQAFATPDAGFVKVFSFVPFFSPMVMFMRLCVTSVQPSEIIISIAINTATITAAGWLSSKIYRAGIMMYGKKPTVKEVLKQLKLS